MVQKKTFPLKNSLHFFLYIFRAPSPRLMLEQLPLESTHPEPGGRGGGGDGGGGVCELQQLSGGEGEAGGLQKVSLGLFLTIRYVQPRLNKMVLEETE